MTVERGADPLWYKDAVIYQLHVKSFFDSNNDGIGDFPGLISKLDYIADLGVNAIWLLPFYPSPRRDDGYDIADYRDVSPDYGTMDDFRRFVDEAHRRGIRVITELVINHTSADHPWFQAARNAPPGSPERDFYVWSDTDEAYSDTRIIFCDTERSNWTWDEVAGAYYWHRFYSHQPDLNFDNPRVLEEVLSVMHFWLDMGVDGLRLDAVPYLIEREGTSNENLAETHDILKRIRADLDSHYPDRMLLAEANMWPEDTQQYFGPGGEECHMAFHFPLMPRMYMAVAQEDRFPITDIMRQTPPIPDNCQWAIFLRNHDELTLEMVTDSERDYLWNTYASDRRARINLGIRRRLAPLMQRDRRRVELMNALLLTMPGTPVLYYGDEIGMGDNIHLGDRDGVRTPMQWSPDRNGGFSRADPASLTLPPVMDPLYGYEAVNVEAQERDPHSLVNWLKRMLAVRGEHQAFGRGTQRFLRPANRKILAYLREWDGESILIVANLSRTAQAVELDLSEFSGRTPVELTGHTAFPQIGQLPYLLTLPPYASYWFLLSEIEEPPEWGSTAPGLAVEQHTFVLRTGIEDLLSPRNLDVLEREVLPEYVPHRRWFGARDEHVRRANVVGTAPFADDLLFSEIEVQTDSGVMHFALPLGIAWDGQQAGPFASNLALGRVRRGRNVGLLTDGFALSAFAHAVLNGVRSGKEIESANGVIRFVPGEELPAIESMDAEWLAAEQSNSSLILDQKVVLKLLRRIQAGAHPEAEMTRYLRSRGFDAVPPLHGEMIRTASDGTQCTLALLQGFVHNQGDGWQWTLDMLDRLATEPGTRSLDFGSYNTFAEVLGTRVAEMHRILAADTEDPDFRPVAMNEEEAQRLGERIAAEVESALDVLDRSEWSGDDAKTARRLSEDADRLLEAVRQRAMTAAGALRTRIHGDLHLGQVLVAGSDVMIIDFEGEPSKPLEERRAKALPLRDVAGVIRSFDYATAIADKQMPTVAETTYAHARQVFSAFCETAVPSFLSAYSAVSGSEPGPLLDLLLLEKVAYELRYEAANRPDWLDVPLAGFARIAGRVLESSE